MVWISYVMDCSSSSDDDAENPSYEASLSEIQNRRSVSANREAGLSLTDVSQTGISGSQSAIASAGLGGRKILNFLQRGFQNKRTKSATKLDKKCECEQQSNSQSKQLSRTFSPHANQTYRSTDCLALGHPYNPFPLPGGPEKGGLNLPLDPHAVIRAVHPSLVGGRKHCFQVSTSLVECQSNKPEDNASLNSFPDQNSACTTRLVTRYYAAQSAGERNRWITELRRTAKPSLENERHRENSLRIWIQEAKNVPLKKRYYCEILLNRILYARTTSKTMSDMLFWGEEFDLNNLPRVQSISIQLWREADPKKKKDKNTLIGFVTIPSCDLEERNEVEQWYPILPPSYQHCYQQSLSTLNSSSFYGGSSDMLASSSFENSVEKSRYSSSQSAHHLSQMANGSSSNDGVIMIRVKARYQSVDILPLDGYKELLSCLSCNSLVLMTRLEGNMSVKAKEDLATAMVDVHQKRGTATQFLTNLVLYEISRLDNDSMAFRGNSMATKSMECYLKLVGEKYLHDTLADFVQTLIRGDEDCEVDPMKLSNGTQLAHNQQNLHMFVDMVWAKIVTSSVYFPRELRSVFSSIRSQMVQQIKKGPDLPDHIISACIFLRYLCPAILSPSLFGLTQEFPADQRIIRNFTLVAKSIQSLANFSPFGAKESYMCFMNRFVEGQMDTMRNFLQRISSPMINSAAMSTNNYFKQSHSLGYLNQINDSRDDLYDEFRNGPSSFSEDYIDLSYELAMIHLHLSPIFDKSGFDTSDENMKSIKQSLDVITNRLKNGYQSERELNKRKSGLNADMPRSQTHSSLASNMPQIRYHPHHDRRQPSPRTQGDRSGRSSPAYHLLRANDQLKQTLPTTNPQSSSNSQKHLGKPSSQNNSRLVQKPGMKSSSTNNQLAQSMPGTNQVNARVTRSSHLEVQHNRPHNKSGTNRMRNQTNLSEAPSLPAHSNSAFTMVSNTSSFLPSNPKTIPNPQTEDIGTIVSSGYHSQGSPSLTRPSVLHDTLNRHFNNPVYDFPSPAMSTSLCSDVPLSPPHSPVPHAHPPVGLAPLASFSSQSPDDSSSDSSSNIDVRLSPDSSSISSSLSSRSSCSDIDTSHKKRVKKSLPAASTIQDRPLPDIPTQLFSPHTEGEITSEADPIQYEQQIQKLRDQLEMMHSKIYDTQALLEKNEQEKLRLLETWQFQRSVSTDSGGANSIDQSLSKKDNDKRPEQSLNISNRNRRAPNQHKSYDETSLNRPNLAQPDDNHNMPIVAAEQIYDQPLGESSLDSISNSQSYADQQNILAHQRYQFANTSSPMPRFKPNGHPKRSHHNHSHHQKSPAKPAIINSRTTRTHADKVVVYEAKEETV